MNRKILIYIFILLLSVLSVVRAEAQSLKAVYENHVLDAVQKYDSGNYDAAIGILNAVLEKDNPIDKSRIVTDEYLDSVKEALVASSVLAKKAGFDGFFSDPLYYAFFFRSSQGQFCTEVSRK